MNSYTNITVTPDIGLRWITMPDGMPHLEIDKMPDEVVQIMVRLKTGDDIVRLVALCHELTSNEVEYALNFMYVSAGRMDRSVRTFSPCMLRVFAYLLSNTISNAYLVNIACPHSSTIVDLFGHAHQLVDNGDTFYGYATANFMYKYCKEADKLTIVIPDLGAVKRFEKMGMLDMFNVVYCEKVREQSTGKLKGFKILAGTPTEHCLIVDDLCDGGGTFKGQAQVLREAGAKVVGLAVVHGIFSKGTLKPDIDWVACSTTFQDTYSDELGVDFVVKVV